MKIKKFGSVIFLTLALFAFSFNIGFAQSAGTDVTCETPGSGSGLSSLIDQVTCILANSVVAIIFALAFVYFMYGVVQYVLMPDGEGKSKGKQMMITGIIALTVMFSVYGLIRVLQNTFGIDDDSTTIKVPKLPQ